MANDPSETRGPEHPPEADKPPVDDVARTERDDGEGDGEGGEEENERTEQVRVVAVEAAVAAGLSPPPEEDETPPGPVSVEPAGAGDAGAFALPDWSDPPTGQVPEALLDEGASEPRPRGPSWRQTSADWEEAGDLDFLVEETASEQPALGRGDDADPFGFEAPATPPEETDDDAWSEIVGPAGGRRHGRSRSAAHRVSGEERARPRRNAVVATLTGIAVAAVAVACFAAGPLAALVLVAVVLALACGETLGAARRFGYRPLALIGLVGVPGIVVAAYLRGPEAIGFGVAAAVVVAGAWRVAVPAPESPLDDVAVTVFCFCWFGALGSFAGLLLNPTRYPLRHGVAYVGAAIALTVADDVASYLVGATVGRHRLVSRVSPGKTIEGLCGGTLAALGAGALCGAVLHPFSFATGIGLGAIVAVLAPLGDLVESLVKRDLGLKDMGRLLPAHGGVTDRIDAMLFVLPATWLFVRLVHVG